MKFASIALSSLFAAGASAFSPTFVPAANAVGRHHRAFVTRSTALQANVLKLSDPTSQILDKTDVFIFDCDGVIWRVCLVLLSLLYSTTSTSPKTWTRVKSKTLLSKCTHAALLFFLFLLACVVMFL